MKPLLLTFNLLCGMDAATTHAALTSGRAYEAWLPTQNPWAIDATVAAQAGTIDALSISLQRNHRKMAQGILYGAIALRGFAIVHNLRTLKTNGASIHP